MASPVNYQPRSNLPTEFALAVTCCRAAYSAAAVDEVRRLAETADWGEFLTVCRRHRVQGLAWHALSDLKVALPPPVQFALAGDARAIAEHGLRCARESARLATAFRDAGIALLFLKGLTLGKLAYGNPFLKMAWDIDLLVLPADVAPAAALLGELGFLPVVPNETGLLLRWHRSRKESVWRGTDGLVVELHSRVADQPDLLPAISASSPGQSVCIAPEIDLPTLADQELFAYLCVHGASSAWFRLKWIADLAALLHGRGAGEIEALYDRSQQFGAERAAAQALLLAQRLYDVPLPSRLANRLSSRVNRWLARSALRSMLQSEPTERPFGTLTIHVTQFFLKAGLGYKLAELRRQGRVAAGMI